MTSAPAGPKPNALPSLERLAPLLTFIFVLLVYLTLPCRGHNFDGVACSIAVELGNFKRLLHGNHLIYGVVGYAWHNLLGAAGLELRALWSLQTLDSILGAAGAALFHLTLLRTGVRPRIAAVCALGLALTYGYWFWSLQAGVYALSALFMIPCLGEVLRQRPRPYRLALWHGLAMLTHGANVMFTPVALFSLLRAEIGEASSKDDAVVLMGSRFGPETRRAAAVYLLCAAGMVLGGYLAAAALWMKPRTAADVYLWLSGSAALGLDRTFHWHGSMSGKNVMEWTVASLRVVSPVGLLALPLWGAALWTLKYAFLGSRDRPLILTAWLWIASYAALFMLWEPYNIFYRVTDLIPLWLLATLAAGRMAESFAGRLVGVLCVAALASANLVLAFIPLSMPKMNPHLQNALWLRDSTPENAWIAAGGEEEVYVPYFAGRHTLNLRYYAGRRGALAAKVWELLDAGKPVYITSSRLKACGRDCRPLVGLRKTSSRQGVALYRVTSIAH